MKKCATATRLATPCKRNWMKKNRQAAYGLTVNTETKCRLKLRTGEFRQHCCHFTDDRFDTQNALQENKSGLFPARSPGFLLLCHHNHRRAQHAVGQAHQPLLHPTPTTVLGSLLRLPPPASPDGYLRSSLSPALEFDFLDLRSIKYFLQLVQSHLHAHFQRIEIAALIQSAISR